MSFPAYPNYRNSGVDWLGPVPSHWDVRRLGGLFSERREKVSDTEFPPLSVTKQGIVPQLETAAKTDDNDDRKCVLSGDFVINSRSDRKGSAGISYENGSVSLINTVITPCKNIDPNFVHYLLRSEPFQEEFYRYGKGIVADLWSTNFSEMKDIVLAYPDKQEQASIAAFLDCETAKIDALVEEQRRLIALLREKRQAVISQAATKGLNPDAQMMDSSVEWLGKVPSHWIVTKAGRYLRILSGFAFPSEGFSTNPAHTRLLRGVNVGVGRVRWDETVYWSRSPGDGLSAFELSDGELVIGMDRPWISEGVRIAKLSAADLPCLLLQRVAALRPHEFLDADYLQILLSIREFVDFFTPDMTGVSVPHLSPSQIMAFPIPLPPRDEQRAIVENVQIRTLEVDRLIASAEEVMTLLAERRSALISAAVFGKIDVRNSAKFTPFKADRVRARALIAAEIIERLAHQATFGRVKLQKVAYLTEAHVGVTELEGAYLREAAGPLDREMISDMEREAGAIAGVRIKQPDGPGSAVAYRIGDRHGVHRHDLLALLGDRAANFDKLEPCPLT